MKLYLVGATALIIIVLTIWALMDTMGAGGFKRMVKITGVYSVCKPDKYEVVCFLDADSKDGGMFCMPLSAVGGQCK